MRQGSVNSNPHGCKHIKILYHIDKRICFQDFTRFNHMMAGTNRSITVISARHQTGFEVKSHSAELIPRGGLFILAFREAVARPLCKISHTIICIDRLFQNHPVIPADTHERSGF